MFRSLVAPILGFAPNRTLRTLLTSVTTMSTSASSPSAPAPWRSALLKDISTMSQATFTLATLHASARAAAAAAPRARTCIFRGLWGKLPPNDRNPAPRNPPALASDLPVFTTDARMAKAGELLGGRREEAEGGAGAGGGGPVEAVWWCEEAQTQWRLRGAAYMFDADADGEGEDVTRAREAVRKRMRRREGGPDEGKDGEGARKRKREGPEGEEEEEEDFSFAVEVTGHFGNLSPMMRGTFRNPPPGTPRAVPGGDGEKLGQKVEDLHDGLARANFRACVVVPAEVELVDLSDSEDPRRRLYSYVGPGSDHKPGRPGSRVEGEWEVCELWP
jgi:pyridoxamine 5'-phosphate oxidase